MNPLVLSLGPFQGITDAPFRNVFKRHFGGIDKYYTPFFTGIHKEEHAKNLQGEEIDPQCNDVETLTPQILSTDAEEILRFAKQCKALGYKEINLNMGCPFPRVANKKRGCGLLPYPDKVETMFERVFEEIDIQFSVKCRLGYFSPDEIDAIIPIFNRFPLSELIIHPRIGKQLYKGEADVERFKALIPYIHAPLVYNGDIFSVESFERIQRTINSLSFGRLRVKPTMTPMERTSPGSVIAGEDPQSPTLVDSFMLGRGILTNPFLAEDIKASVIASEARQSSPLDRCNSDGLDCFIVPPRNDAKRQKERLHAYVLDLYEDRLRHAGGSPKVLGRMKELWSYLMNSFEEPQVIWRKIKKINALKEYEDAVETIFKEIAIK
ncbi:MAG: tRNA-dihydrouridine synthase family protein [Bacteroidales bacterium]|nr:tRNA-dihydrouridine synthase family protein [Bacteroidales bacterium]